MALRRTLVPGRNQPCFCGSGTKYKKCCGRAVIARPVLRPVPEFIDQGETAVRWVIVDNSGTRLFADVAGRALVFQCRDDAYAVTQLEDFNDQSPGEINVAAVGPHKWAVLQAKVPFVEVPNVATAATLVRERIAQQRQRLAEESAGDEKLTEE
jgi:hypothetical protein